MKAGLYYIALAGMIGAACDTVQPAVENRLVVEAYAKAGDPLPVIRLRRTLSLGQPYVLGTPTAAAGARVTALVDGVEYSYAMDAPGVYEPVADYLLEAQSELGLNITWEDQRAVATTRLPPPLKLDDVKVEAGERPLSGLILDSLFIDRSQIDTLRFDSLRTGASEGYVYLIEVTVQWTVDFAEDGPDAGYWIRTELRPYLNNRTRLDDFFLRPDQLLRETHVVRDEMGLRTWTGVYAVPVEYADSSLPSHRLRVTLVRGTQAYAQFVSGISSPKHREPPSNIDGALGILAGISVDSLNVVVE